ncbi:hypothetical protein, partial [Vibrio parahaemolyticus]|uniref:hypothetical protein n=1 Tax=Vibrio parahaemolyticus TaxID=670 RepID=UPI001C60C7A9
FVEKEMVMCMLDYSQSILTDEVNVWVETKSVQKIGFINDLIACYLASIALISLQPLVIESVF